MSDLAHRHLNCRPSLAVLTLTVKLWKSKHSSLVENVLVCGILYVVLGVPGEESSTLPSRVKLRGQDSI